LYADLPVRLSRPLGSRTLFDADSGLAIGFVEDLAAPTPSYLPAGYTGGAVVPAGPGGAGPVVRQYDHGGDSIEIHARSATGWSAPDDVLATTTVAGHGATVFQESYQRCVSWSQDPGILLEVCSLTDGAELPSAELLKIARSLH
jgi:hypothetical protein